MVTSVTALGSSSTTSTRRIFSASIMQVVSYRLVPVVTCLHGEVIASLAVPSSGLRPCATMRTVISRSVMVPIS